MAFSTPCITLTQIFQYKEQDWRSHNLRACFAFYLNSSLLREKDMFTFCVMALGPLSLFSLCSISLCRLFVLITEFPALTPSLLSPIHDHKTDRISVFMIQGSHKSYPRNQNYWFGGDDDMIDTQVSSCRWPLLLEDAFSSPALSAASTSSASPGI